MKKAISLFVGADIHALNGNSNLKRILSLVSRDTTPDVVLLGGDHVGSVGRVRPKKQPGETNSSPMRNMTEEEKRNWQPIFCLNDLRYEIIDIFGEQTKTYFTYGSHDKNEANGAANFFCGPASFEHYHLYGISFC